MLPFPICGNKIDDGSDGLTVWLTKTLEDLVTNEGKNIMMSVSDRTDDHGTYRLPDEEISGIHNELHEPDHG